MDLDRIRSGDERALAQLLKESWAPLVRYLGTLSETREAAEDAAQEAFVRLWEHRERWTAGTARGLLFRIGRNVALDSRRKGEVRSRLRVESANAAPRRPPTPADALLESEAAARIRAAVAALPDRRGEVFTLVRYHGLSYREVADALDISELTVANHLSRALAELREHLPDLLGDNPRQRADKEGNGG